jgi:hypothetical protein
MSEDVIADPPFVFHYMRYFSQYEEEFDTPEEALEYWDRGEEDGALSGIDVTFEDRCVLSAGERCPVIGEGDPVADPVALMWQRARQRDVTRSSKGG